MKKVKQVFNEAFDKIEAEFPDIGSVALDEDDRAGADNGVGSERQFAYAAEGDPIVIAFAPKASELPKSHLKGLMRHEFGHALEYRYGVKELEKRLGLRLPEKVERRADVIAETVWGEPIVYDARDIQCVGVHGKQRRPRRLPDKKEVLRPNARRTASRLPDELPEWTKPDEKKLKELHDKTQGEGPKDWLDCLSDREIEEALFGFSSMNGTITLETDEIEWVDAEGPYESVLEEVEEEGPDYYDTDSTIIVDLTWDGTVELNDGHHRYIANREYGDDSPMTAEVQIPPGLARAWARKLIASVESGDAVASGDAEPLTVSQLEAEAGPTSTWPGKCDLLAHLAAAKTGGRPVYGHWLGDVNEEGYWADYAGRPFVRHGWVELPDGRVLDPTRWSFEDVEPYIWVGENDGSYDEGGARFYSAMRSPPPENDPEGKQIPLGVSDRCAKYLNDLLGRPNEPTASPRQMMWLANVDPDTLADCAAELHDALSVAGLSGFIPVDYAQAVKSRR